MMRYSKAISDDFNNRFSIISKLKNEYQGEYPLMDFGIGEDKSFVDLRILETLVSSLKVKSNHKYVDRGVKNFKALIHTYLTHNFNINISENEIALTMGTKEGLAILPALFVEQDDIVLATTPGYVVLEKVSKLFKGQVISLPLLKENNFLPDFSSIDEETWKKVKILSLNYPNNPTGAIATREFYEYVVSLARKYDFLIVNDAAYLEFTYEGEPLSILSIEGAKDVAVELYTFSKSYNMTGYRIGFIAGNEDIISKFETIVDFYDSGQFAPIEYAAMTALQNHDIVSKLKNKYYIRMENIVDIFNDNGFQVEMSKGTFYLYVKVPSKFKNALEFSSKLLNEVGIMTIPYSGVEEYVRLSMTFETDYILPFYLSLDDRLKEFNKNNS